MDPFGRLRSLLSLAYIFLLETISPQSLSPKWFRRYGRSCRTILDKHWVTWSLGHVPDISWQFVGLDSRWSSQSWSSGAVEHFSSKVRRKKEGGIVKRFLAKLFLQLSVAHLSSQQSNSCCLDRKKLWHERTRLPDAAM